MTQTTISVSPETRDRIRELKGVERTYDEVLHEMVEQFEPDAAER